MTRDAVDEPGALTLLDLTANGVDVDTMTGPVSAGFDVHKKERGGAGVGENISKMRDGGRSTAVRVGDDGVECRSAQLGALGCCKWTMGSCGAGA